MEVRPSAWAITAFAFHRIHAFTGSGSGYVSSKLGGAGDSFGDYPWVDCVNLLCVTADTINGAGSRTALKTSC